jgi:hypothetical protein
MSLRAYNGMMTKKGFKYIQDETIKRIDKFKDISKNKIAERYADLFVKYLDLDESIKSDLKFDAINEKDILSLIDKINSKNILYYIFQTSKILSKSKYLNDFTVHLNLTIEEIENKILVYPNILVNEHKDILLEYLEDWYCQNQCDPDDRVPEDEWNERSKDWYVFNEISNYLCQIQLFKPDEIFNNLLNDFRGDDLINRILKFIPSKEKRIKDKAIHLILKEYEMNDVFDYLKLKKELLSDNRKVQNYIDEMKVDVVDINYDLIKDLEFKK